MSTMTAPLAARLYRQPRTMPLAVVPMCKPPTQSPRELAPAPLRARRLTIRRCRGRLVVPEGAIVILIEWGCPFRIHKAAAGRKPFRVDWYASGMGLDRRCPDCWLAPINCPDRRAAQHEILAALELWLEEPEQADLVAKIRADLRGKPLACLCGHGTPCHGDVLVRIANQNHT
jgi:hypothetical protein